MKIQIKSASKYGQALKLLLSWGGTFWAWPDRVLQIGHGQYQGLVQAGVIQANGKVSTHGKKKKKV